MAKVYANKHHVVSLPTKHVRALLYLIHGVDTGLPPEDVVGAAEQMLRVLEIELEDAELDMSDRCDQCGKETGSRMDTGVCGMCADDFNTNPPAVGRKRINRRRAMVGLDPLVWDDFRAVMSQPIPPMPILDPEERRKAGLKPFPVEGDR